MLIQISNYLKKKLKSIFNLFYKIQKKIFLNFYSIFLINLEIKRIKLLSNSQNKEINLVYDLSFAPFTYGDLYSFLFLGRYFIFEGYKLNFFLIDDVKKNKDIKYLDVKNLSFFVKELKNISLELLNHKNSSIIFCSWEEFLKSYKGTYKDKITLFQERVLDRKNIYCFSFKMLNYLLKNTSQKKIKNILLDKNFKKDYQKNINFDLQKKFITWGLRFNKFYGNNRNNSETEFVETYKLLLKFFPNKDIIVISDIAGTEYFKKISEKNNFSLIFSKDFTNSFLEDALLILNSKFHYQIHGGASATVAVFSNVRFIIFGTPVNEKLFLRNKFSFWQMENQVFKNIKKNTKFNKTKLEIELYKMFS